MALDNNKELPLIQLPVGTPDSNDFVMFTTSDGLTKIATFDQFQDGLVTDLTDLVEQAEAAAAAAGDKMPAMTVAQLKLLTDPVFAGVSISDSWRSGNFFIDNATGLAVDDAMVIQDASGNKWVRKGFEEVKVDWFGAAGNGTTDDTASINAALAIGKLLGLDVSGSGRTYAAAGVVNIDAIKVKAIKIALTTNTATVRLTGNAPQLVNSRVSSTVAVGALYGQYGGLVNTHNSTNALIDGVTFTATVRRIGINCISKASDTVIHNCDFYTAWGILFNDLTTSTDRIVDGVTYTGSIGEGLTVLNCRFHGPSDSGQTGDAIEVNVPEFRFANVKIFNNRIYKTYASSNVGLGIGLAQIDGAVVAYNYVTDVLSEAGALHCEQSTNVEFISNTVKNCQVGGSFSTSVSVLVQGNFFDGCMNFGIKSQNTGDTNMQGLTIDSNVFIRGTGNNDIALGNIVRVTISKNKFLGMGAALTHMNFLLYGTVPTGSRNVKFYDNDFLNTTGFSSSIISAAATDNFEWYSRGNNFSNLSTPAASFMAAVSLRGVCEDTYRAGNTADNVKGAIFKSIGTPQGYLTGAAGRVADDILNGLRYRYDTTAAAWTVPGQSFSNPLNVGDAYLWRGADRRLRFNQGNAGAPTADTSGGLIPVRSNSIPSTPTTAGSLGGVAWDAGDFYYYAGDGTTHNWIRISGNEPQLKTVTADYTALMTDGTILVDATAGNVTINLPSIVTAVTAFGTSRRYVIKKIDSSANTAIIDPSGGQTIEGYGTFTLRDQNEAVFIQATSTGWVMLGHYVQTALHVKNFTASGDGSTTAIAITHGLGYTPVISAVLAQNAASAGFAYVTANSTTITITYGVAPASGTNNLSFNITYKR